MKYTNMGRTGMKVSRLCLGTMNFGAYTQEKEAFAIMERAVEAGINYFDTANEYGDFFGVGRKGASEEIIGKWFAQGGGRREKVILATKVYCSMEDVNDGPNNGEFISAYKIRRHLEGSLRRLGTDHIELYQMHHIDRSVTWEELWGVFEALVNQGKVYYIGSSNFAGWHIMKAQEAAAKRNFLGLVCEQHLYNLMKRLPELELLPVAKEKGLGVVLWGPLNGGSLAGNMLNPKKGSRSEKKQSVDPVAPELRAKLEAYAKLCDEMGESQANVALAWTLANPVVTAPIIGPRTLEQLEDCLHAVDIELSDEIMHRLDEIFPGPGGAAPEAYAW